VCDRGADIDARLALVHAAVEGGVDWLQVRDRSLESAELLDFAERVAATARAAARERDVRVIVNRRTDIALALGDAGVHLGFDAVAASDARALLGEGALVGISAHGADELGAAPGASYAHLAPIFPPLSKAPTRTPLGLDHLAAAARAPLPLIAQGGIEPGNAAAVVRAGAAGVAVTGAVLQADDPGGATRALRCALAEAG